MAPTIAEPTREVVPLTTEQPGETMPVLRGIGCATLGASVELDDTTLRPEASHPDCRQADKVCPAACGASDRCMAQ